MILLDIKRNYFIIKTGSQDSQKLYEPFPDLFGSFREKYCLSLLLTTSDTNIRPYWTYFDNFWATNLNICWILPSVYLEVYWCISIFIFVWLYTVWIRYLWVSVDQISLGIWYLWTRYAWVSVDQISMGICGPDIYGYLVPMYQVSMGICGPGIKVSRY